MAEPNAQQLARQRLASTDLTKFAPPKRKKAEPEPPKYTKPAVKTGAEERKAHKGIRTRLLPRTQGRKEEARCGVPPKEPRSLPQQQFAMVLRA